MLARVDCRGDRAPAGARSKHALNAGARAATRRADKAGDGRGAAAALAACLSGQLQMSQPRRRRGFCCPRAGATGPRTRNYESHSRAQPSAQVAGPRAPRGRAPQHLPDPRQRAAQGRRRPASTCAPPTSTSRSPRACRPWSATAGTTTVPAHTLYEIVRKLSDGAEVRLETEGAEQMLLTSGRSRFHLACLSPDSFPDLKSGAFTHEFSLPAASAARADRAHPVRHLQRGDALLPQRHLHPHPRGGRASRSLRAVATDGHRMARAETEAPAGSKGMPGIIVPKKTVSEVQKLLDGAEGDVKVEVSDTKIRFTLDGGGAALQADRGHLPRLRAGDAQEQRQADERRPRRASPPPSTASRPLPPTAAARRSSSR